MPTESRNTDRSQQSVNAVDSIDAPVNFITTTALSQQDRKARSISLPVTYSDKHSDHDDLDKSSSHWGGWGGGWGGGGWGSGWGGGWGGGYGGWGGGCCGGWGGGWSGWGNPYWG